MRKKATRLRIVALDKRRMQGLGVIDGGQKHKIGNVLFRLQGTLRSQNL
jgi:hypothetical protein